MAEALAADPAELDRMGRAGAVRAAGQHDAAAEAGKLAALIAGPAAIGHVPERPVGALQVAAAGVERDTS